MAGAGPCLRSSCSAMGIGIVPYRREQNSGVLTGLVGQVSPDATAPGPGRGIGSDLRFQLYEASDLAAVDPEVPFDVGRQPPGDGGYVDACSSTTLVRFSRHVASPAISCCIPCELSNPTTNA